jgi:hypothetical protein
MKNFYQECRKTGEEKTDASHNGAREPFVEVLSYADFRNGTEAVPYRS